VGKHYNVLVTEKAHDGDHMVGHNEFYEQVLLPNDANLMGKLVSVEIVATSKFSMVGKPVKPATEVGMKPPKKVKFKAVWPLRSSWVHKLSVVVLAIAIGVRLLQFLLMQSRRQPQQQTGETHISFDEEIQAAQPQQLFSRVRE